VLQGCTEKSLCWKEKNDKLWRGLEVLPVSLLPKYRDMCFHLTGVVFKTLQTNDLIFRMDRLKISFQRDFCIDDDLSSSRQSDNEIGSQSAGVADLLLLFEKVAMIKHPCKLNDTTQLNLSPAASSKGCP